MEKGAQRGPRFYGERPQGTIQRLRLYSYLHEEPETSGNQSFGRDEENMRPVRIRPL